MIIDNQNAGLNNNVPASKDTNNIPDYSEMLPDNTYRVLSNLTDVLKWDVDYCLLPLIVTAAGAIGNARQTSIAGYSVHSILYGCAVGSPSVNKSEPSKFAVKPLREAFKLTYEAYKDEYAAWKEMPDKDKRPEPTLAETVFSDITIEKVATNLQNNPKGGILAADELKGWLNSFHRYNKGNAEQTYIELFNCTPLTVSRMQRETVFIPRPYLSIIGTTQPDVIHRTFKGAANNGLKERLIFVYPDVKPLAWNREATKEQYHSALTAWRSIITPLLNLQADELGEPVYLPMSPEAKEVLFDWQQNNTQRKIDNPDFSSMLGKADIICPRLALVLALMHEPGTEYIVEVDAIRAVNMMEHLIQHGQKVMQVIKEGEPGKPNPKQMLFAGLNDEFTTQEAIIKGAEMEISERTVKRYLKDTTFCKSIRHGMFSKL